MPEDTPLDTKLIKGQGVGRSVSGLREEAPRTRSVLPVGLVDISRTVAEGLPRTLASVSLRGRAQVGEAVLWGCLAPAPGEGGSTQCGKWDLMGSVWSQEWRSRVNSSVRVVHLRHRHSVTGGPKSP